MTRRRWIAAGVVALVVVVAVIFWAATRPGNQASSPGPSISPSGSPTSSTPTPPPQGSGSPSPSVSGSTAPDGRPLVTVETPRPGEHSNIPVRASGTAIAVKGVARYEILQDGKVFINGPLYVSRAAPQRGHWETDIELPIGTYTLVVFVESAEDGTRLAQTEVPFFAG